MDRAIYDKLKAVARAGSTIFYSDLAPLTDLAVDSEYFGALIGQRLDEINRYEHERGRPLLSAVVITKEHNIPGTGFFTCAQELGVFPRGDKDEFWLSELTRVHACWKQRESDQIESQSLDRE
jgi:hypothetical protein